MTRYPALILLSALPAGAFALGLGDIQLNSALNQPLDAEIEILSATPAELRDLQASIASRETFGRYGLGYPQFLNSLSFNVATDASGRDVLQVKSTSTISEPFLTFLVEAEWDSGTLLREYTVLLDPPVFITEAVPAPVAPARGVNSQPAPGEGRIERPQPAPPPREPAPAPVRPSVVAQLAPEPAPAPRQVPEFRSNASEYGPVQRGDTLWGIANRTRPDGVSVNQMIMALYRANPEAFLGNINLLKEGSVLRVPGSEQLADVDGRQANVEVQRQTEDWRGGASASGSASRVAGGADESARLKLVAPESTDPALQGSVAGADSAASGAALAEARRTISSQEVANEELSDRVSSLESALAEARRLVELKDSELADLQQRLGASESAAATDSTAALPATGSAGVDLESTTDGESVAERVESGSVSAEESASLTSVAESADTTAAESVSEAAAVADTEAAAEAEAVTPVADSARDTGGSWMDSVLGLFKSAWLWIALGLTSLLAAAIIALRGRRPAVEAAETLEALAREDDTDDIAPITEPTRIAARESDPAPAEPLPAPAAEFDDVFAPDPQTRDDAQVEVGRAVESGVFEDTGTFRPVDFDVAMTEETGETAEYPFDASVPDGAAALDQADPVSEADFHMAYGLYDQAAELVQKALERHPQRRDLQLKLLEIFFVWGNRDEFLAHSRSLRQSLTSTEEGEWDKIVIMGKQICPEDPLFASEETVVAKVLDAGIDLDLDAGGELEAPLDLETANEESDEEVDDALDLDLGEALAANSDLRTTKVARAPDLMSDDGSLDLELARSQEIEQPAMQDDEELNEIARKLERRMTGGGTDTEATDLGLTLDLGQTIAPETVETPTLTSEPDADDSGADDSAEIFGDFFAFTGVAEDTAEATGPAEIPLDIGGELLPESPTSEFKIELPDEAAEMDFDLGDADASGEDDVTVDDQMRPDFESDTATLPASAMPADKAAPGATDVFEEMGTAEFGELDTTESPMLGDSVSEKDIKTVQAPIVGFDEESGFVSSTDETVAANVVDLDVGDFVDGEERPTTVRVPAADLALPESQDDALDEVGTKLDLARAYIDMGDSDGARSILEEVVEEGDPTQRDDAQGLLQSLAS